MTVIFAGLNHRTLWGSQVQFSDKICLHACYCATNVLVQTVHDTVWFSAVQFITVVNDAFTLCSPFHCRQARVARRHALLGPLLVMQVLNVLARRCTTPGAGFCLCVFAAPLFVVSVFPSVAVLLLLVGAVCLFLGMAQFEGRRGFAQTWSLSHF